MRRVAPYFLLQLLTGLSGQLAFHGKEPKVTFPLRLVGGSDLWRQTIDIAGDLTQSAHPIHDIHPTFHQGVRAVTTQLHPDPGFTNNDMQLPLRQR